MIIHVENLKESINNSKRNFGNYEDTRSTCENQCHFYILIMNMKKPKFKTISFIIVPKK
jgi:hypothetical protein